MAVPDQLRQIVGEMPGLNKREREIIYNLLVATLGFHRAVFQYTKTGVSSTKGDYPIFAISEEVDDESLIAYANAEDCYAIFPFNIREKFRSIQRQSFLNIWDEEAVKIIKEISESETQISDREIRRRFPRSRKVKPFRWQEIIIGIAAHEVRHRAQVHFPIRLPSVNEILQIARKDMRILTIGICVNILGRDDLAERETKRELDAAIVGHLAIRAYQEKRSPEEVVHFIKTELVDLVK